ncbi:hypothetical protein KAFR_0F01750 [Kazachstania africana CBS 2517]|uniref:Peptidase M20 dimerisation domain-containing protein n=1 Tax=Kazachstania africana (strain ATCC 22294 / BCRC 22015 / CBS 2517 / CECT 1963 / NBRC 1671 / NRRL Y-8276) TaxID=1071382 RepID=H2AWM2_KAZAF|nr:hypothetical protein KAFR_0F01750 [Kazachstania africana CBS 2517]CCF58772.1 hypothetical protein KAFR_0F01750 [Kazachstania africana CBS 2517]
MQVFVDEKFPEGSLKVRRGYKKVFFSIFATVLLGVHLILSQVHFFENDITIPSYKQPRCGKTEAISPSFDVSVQKILNDPDFKLNSIEKLSKAIQIPTEVHDVNPIPSENPSYYNNFFRFHQYLESTFPLVHKHLKKELVNGVGLLYTWEGKNETQKPVILMAHQDTVPVNNDTLSEWEYPPFSGHYDSETDLIWGRGSNDCKNLLIAEFEAIEQLLEDGFQTERTVILSLGFDEESSGLLGAGTLGPFLHERYGDDGILIIVDEGDGIMEIDDGIFVASPINAEKGYVDVEVTIRGHGGHSSVPPDHTNIGIAAELITLLEKNPFEYRFDLDNPLYNLLTCTAEHSKSISQDLKDVILEAPYDKVKKNLLTEFVSKKPDLRDLIRTTQAIDIINGGVKANALPETVSFLVNHRINLHSSIDYTVERDLNYIKQIAKKYDFGIFYDGKFLKNETKNGYFDIKILKPLAPAPVSPNEGPVWDMLAGTIQDLFQNKIFDKQENNTNQLYVTTGLFSGNTDTKHYWALSKNIYRFIGSIVGASTLKTVHSVNEHIEVEGHLSAIAFVYEFIVNVSEYKES